MNTERKEVVTYQFTHKDHHLQCYTLSVNGNNTVLDIRGTKRYANIVCRSTRCMFSFVVVRVQVIQLFWQLCRFVGTHHNRHSVLNQRNTNKQLVRLEIILPLPCFYSGSTCILKGRGQYTCTLTWDTDTVRLQFFSENIMQSSGKFVNQSQPELKSTPSTLFQSLLIFVWLHKLTLFLNKMHARRPRIFFFRVRT